MVFSKALARLRGDEGERLASKHLKSLGYKILEKNYHCRTGEVDILASKGEVLIFVEVKARGSERFGTALEAVDQRKQRRIISAARHWMAAKGVVDTAVRFDVVAVDLSASPPGVEVVGAAFEVPA